MSLEKVTVGIPFYNAEKYLSDAIKSVIHQTYKNWNLILIDDGSSDSSLSIAQSFASEKISVFSDGKKRGLVYRLNQLIEMADGVFYARMDADDIMHFERLEKQVNLLQKDLNLDVVGSSYYAIDSENLVVGFRKSNLKPEGSFNIMLRGCFAHPSVLGRLDWFRLNKYDENCERMEDLELWLRTISKSNFKNVNEPLLFYRVFGVPLLSKYVKSNLGIIKLLLKGYKYNLTFLQCAYLNSLYFFKIFVYIVLFFIGKLDLILNKRFVVLDEVDQLKVKEIIRKSLGN